MVPKHNWSLQYWFCLFEIPSPVDGKPERHLIRATGPQDKAETAALIGQMHPQMKIVDLHPMRDHQELVEATAELAKNPNWTPLTNEGLQELANNASQQNQIPQDVLSNPTSQPIVDATGRPIAPQTSPLTAPQASQQQPQAIPVQP